MVTSLRCPVCSEQIESYRCRECDVDLTPLIDVRAAAHALARRALALARRRQLSRAADCAERALHLYSDDDLLQLYGWILFLDGRMSQAVRCWGSLPEEAKRVVTSYNTALECVREGRWADARGVLHEVELPFRHVLVLKLKCARHLGDELEAEAIGATLARAFPDLWDAVEEQDRRWSAAASPAVQESRAASSRVAWVAGGALLLLVGLGSGYLAAGGGVGSDPGESGAAMEEAPQQRPDASTVGADEGSASESEATPVPDSLRYGWAYLQRDHRTIAGVARDAVSTAPAEPLRGVPAEMRRRVARGWYLEGLRLARTGQPGEAVPRLTAAVVSVGSGGDLYWVDDALYFLMRSAEAVDGGSGARWARALKSHHEASMYLNSVTDSIAAMAGARTNDPR